MQWMTMREFLRGGYRDLTDITVVSNHGRPVFTVHPLHPGTTVRTADKTKDWVPPMKLDPPHRNGG